MRVVATPDYLVRCGTPRDLEELATHNRIGYCFARMFDAWPFRTPAGASAMLPVIGNVQVSDGESLRCLALAGAGMARLSLFLIGPDIKAGRLVPILEDFNPGVETIATGRGGAGKAADTDAEEERMTEIGVWAIVVLLAVIAYVVGRRDWAHERQISAVLTSLSDTYRTGFSFADGDGAAA